MAAFEPYYFEPNVIQTIQNDSSEDSVKRIHFADLLKDAKLVSCSFLLDGMTSPKYCMAANYSFQMTTLKMNLGFFQE